MCNKYPTIYELLLRAKLTDIRHNKDLDERDRYTLEAIAEIDCGVISDIYEYSVSFYSQMLPAYIGLFREFDPEFVDGKIYMHKCILICPSNYSLLLITGGSICAYERLANPMCFENIRSAMRKHTSSLT